MERNRKGEWENAYNRADALSSGNAKGKVFPVLY
jgi:hypothetical protein